MHTIEELQDIVQKALELESFLSEPKELYNPIEYTMAIGGKRLRPVLALMGCELFNGNLEDAIPTALAIEIFHNFTLVHDDIMDNAPLRRGKDTVFRRWNANIALLSGDAMFAKAYQVLARSKPSILPKILPEFSKTALEVCEGQQYDMNFETSNNVSIADYISMIKLKTAVLVGGSLKIGAIIAGAPEKDTEYLYNFGENIGMAFQLQDDLLDVFSKNDKFGKLIGGDIVSNKKTFLYIKALELADNDSKKELLRLYSKTPKNDDEKIARVKGIFLTLGIKEFTRNIIDEYFVQAMQYFNKINVPDEKKTALLSFVDGLKKRDY